MFVQSIQVIERKVNRPLIDIALSIEKSNHLLTSLVNLYYCLFFTTLLLLISILTNHSFGRKTSLVLLSLAGNSSKRNYDPKPIYLLMS